MHDFVFRWISRVGLFNYQPPAIPMRTCVFRNSWALLETGKWKKDWLFRQNLSSPWRRGLPPSMLWIVAFWNTRAEIAYFMSAGGYLRYRIHKGGKRIGCIAHIFPTSGPRTALGGFERSISCCLREIFWFLRIPIWGSVRNGFHGVEGGRYLLPWRRSSLYP